MKKIIVLISTALALAGCGGSSDSGTEQAGLNIFSIKAFPAFSGFVNPTVIVQHGPVPILKLQAAGAPGSFCSEFCYLKQGIEEAVRQNQELDFFLCLSRKANEKEPAFEIPSADGCGYFEITPPAFSTDAGPDGVRLDLPAKIQARLCRNGNQVRIHTCGDGELQQEALLTNNTTDESVAATVVKRLLQSNGCEDKYKIDFQSNCTPGAFGNAVCAATVNGNYCGCYGNGTINVSVTGGAEPRIQYESDFAANGLGDGTFGIFDVCSHGDWSEGGEGCFQSQAEGSFPAIPSAEVPLNGLDGCKAIAGAASVCPNPDFDPDAFDPLYPVCPFVAANGASCGFSFSAVNCCGLTGDSLSALGGEDIDDAPLSSLLDDVSGRACAGQGNCGAVAFEDAWDCAPPSGQTFAPVNLLGASGVDLTECANLLTAVNTFTADENCSEQTADASSDEIAREVGSLTGCQLDSECASGEVCHLMDNAQGVCVPEPADCDLSSPACAAGETCAYDPQFDRAKCVPDYVCDASCTSGQPCNAATGACEFVPCTFLSTDTCAARLGTGYSCNFTLGHCEP
ncbi:MAG TPA: hypothetical protein VLJ37_04360 [bacterium]|nr:hypothetical protein [bacterium]